MVDALGAGGRSRGGRAAARVRAARRSRCRRSTSSRTTISACGRKRRTAWRASASPCTSGCSAARGSSRSATSSSRSARRRASRASRTCCSRTSRRARSTRSSRRSRELELPLELSGLRGNGIACTGEPHCNYSVTETKSRLDALIDGLEERFGETGRAAPAAPRRLPARVRAALGGRHRLPGHDRARRGGAARPGLRRLPPRRARAARGDRAAGVPARADAGARRAGARARRRLARPARQTARACGRFSTGRRTTSSACWSGASRRGAGERRRPHEQHRAAGRPRGGGAVGRVRGSRALGRPRVGDRAVRRPARPLDRVPGRRRRADRHGVPHRPGGAGVLDRHRPAPAGDPRPVEELRERYPGPAARASLARRRASCSASSTGTARTCSSGRSSSGSSAATSARCSR